MGPPTVAQRVDQLEEKAKEVEESMAEMVSKAVEKAMEAMRHSLTEVLLDGQTLATKKLEAMAGQLDGRIHRSREYQEALINTMRNEQIKFQAEMTSTLTEIQSNWISKIQGSINQPEPGAGSAGMLTPLVGFDEFGKGIGGRNMERGSYGGGSGGGLGNWRYRKLDMPIFDGSDPDGWIMRVERYFTFYRLSEAEMLEAVAVAMEGDALRWYQWENKRHPIRRWEDLKVFILRQFRSINGGSQWLATTQTTTVGEYRRKFIETAPPLDCLSEDILLGHFINGLKEQVKAEVRLIGPINLEQAMELAIKVEEKQRVMGFKKQGLGSIETGFYSNSIKSPSSAAQYSIGSPHSPSTPSWATGYSESQDSVHSPKSTTSPAKTVGEVKRLTEKELQEKRAKGLCYRCDEKWVMGHKCRRKELSVLLIEEDEEETDGDGSEAPPSPTEELATEARYDSLRAAPVLSTQSIPKQHITTNNSVTADQSSAVDGHSVSKARRYVQVTAGPHTIETQKPAVHPVNGVPMQMPFHQSQIPAQFGGINLQLQSQSMVNSSMPIPMPIPMRMPFPMGNHPQVQQQVYFQGLPPHGVMHQGQGTNFTSQMGTQLPHLGNIGININPQFSQKPRDFGNARKTVKITHPDTHEELSLVKKTDTSTEAGSSAALSQPNIPPQLLSSSTDSKDKPMLETNISKNTIARGKKERKKALQKALQKADRAGTTADLYMAYKCPDEKKETLTNVESSETTSSHAKEMSCGTSHEETPNESKAEPDDWEDAADFSTPKLEFLEDQKQLGEGKHHLEDESAMTRKYSRDFLLKFREQYTDLPDDFDPRAQIPVMYSGFLSGPVQYMNQEYGMLTKKKKKKQYGMQQTNSDAERWQHTISSQRGLLPTPRTPAQVMHKAEQKYEVDCLITKTSSLSLGARISHDGDKLAPDAFTNRDDAVGRTEASSTVSGMLGQNLPILSVTSHSELPCATEVADGTDSKDKPMLETNISNKTKKKRKEAIKRKEALQKANRAGTTADLYMAYKGPDEKKETLTNVESSETTSSHAKEMSSGTSHEETPNKSKAEPDDWEDAADLSTLKLESLEDQKQLGEVKHHLEDESAMTRKYSRDFLLKFWEQYTDLPDGFDPCAQIPVMYSGVLSGPVQYMNQEYGMHTKKKKLRNIHLREVRYPDQVSNRSRPSTPQTRSKESSSVKNIPPEKVLPEEQLRKMSMETIKEFYSAKDEKEVALCVKDLNAPGFYPSMIYIWITDSFERKDMERDLLAKLLINLAKSRDALLSQPQLVEGFKSVLASLEDAVIDAPKAPEFLGGIFAKVVLENVLPLAEIGRLIYEGGEEQGQLVDSGLAAKVVGRVLEIIKKEKGESVLKEIRTGSGLRLENFRHPNSKRPSSLYQFI